MAAALVELAQVWAQQEWTERPEPEQVSWEELKPAVLPESEPGPKLPRAQPNAPHRKRPLFLCRQTRRLFPLELQSVFALVDGRAAMD